MLPKSSRLNLSKDFKWVASGQKKETPNLKLMYRFGNNNLALVGIALSGQNFKNASQRNRARRLVSKSVEVNYQLLPKKLNLVIMPKRSVLETKVADLIEEVKNVTSALSPD